MVTILFVDLVGFTERSDRADPEDDTADAAAVPRARQGGHRALRRDARQVRSVTPPWACSTLPRRTTTTPPAPCAASRILVSMEQLRRTDRALAVRVAVNTGEAMVSFGTGPQIGEAVAGDVVNTASRMQGLAPHGSVVIGEDDDARGAGARAGGASPGDREGQGGPDPGMACPRRAKGPPTGESVFVVRRHERRLPEQRSIGVVASATGQLVTVVGEPGMGKTRLVEEFRGIVAGRGRWLAGRCLPIAELDRVRPSR